MSYEKEEVYDMYVMDKKEIEAISEVITSTHLDRYIDGTYSQTSLFEKEFANKIGVNHALAVNSGTSALICGLVGMEIGPGDEVIIPGYTYVATALAVLAVGAIPIIAEIDETLTIDPIDIKKKITKQTKAIIPVHMCGLPCNMYAIMQLAKKYRIRVLEDVAQACGGSYQGQMLGSIGDAGMFSLNHYKIISCGEGGILTTNNKLIQQRAMLQHDGGCIYERKPPEINIPIFAGWNFRMSEILSAVARVQVNRLDGILSELRLQKSTIIQGLININTNFKLVPSNDSDGDCGTTIFLMFDSDVSADAFKTYSNINAWSPDYSGHVYSDWIQLMEKRGSHHNSYNSFTLSEKYYEYSKDMCPRTLSLLKRTVGISTAIGRNGDEINILVDKIMDISK